MRERLRRAPWSALLIVLLVVTSLNGYATPASATLTDLFNTVPSGWSSPNNSTFRKCSSDACSTVTGFTDANDTTYSGGLTFIAGNGCSSPVAGTRQCYWGGFFSHAVDSSTVVLKSFRLKWGESGGTITTLTRLQVKVTNNGTETTCYSTTTVAASGDLTVNCSTNVTMSAASQPTGVFVYFDGPQYCGGGCGNDSELRLYTFEVYGDPYIVTGNAGDYIFGLVCSNTTFSKTCSWLWAKSYTGTWQVARNRTTPAPDTSVIKSGTNPLANNVGDTCRPSTGDGCVSYFSDPCGIDGCSGWIISGLDNDAAVSWSYTIPANADGTLIVSPPRVLITALTACYNANFHQCVPPGTSNATTIDVTYGIGPLAEGADVVVQIGSQYLYGPGFDGSPWYTATVGGGSHTINAVVQSPYPIAGQKLLIVATGPHNSDVKLYSVNWVDGGRGPAQTYADPSNPSRLETCSFEDVGCFLRNVGTFIANALGSIFAFAVDALNVPVSAAMDKLREVAMTKQPFNFMVRGVTGVSTQIARAQAAVTSTTSCPGVTLTFPGTSLPFWPAGMANPTWTVLDCATLEPLVGRTDYQAIRSAMTPAIYLLFAYQQLKRLQPRPVMSG